MQPGVVRVNDGKKKRSFETGKKRTAAMFAERLLLDPLRVLATTGMSPT